MAQKLLVTVSLVIFFSVGFSQIINPRECPRLLMQNEIEGESAVCHSFTVPQNWSQAEGKSIELAVLTLKSRGPSKADPILFLQGGPGGAALSTIEFWQELSWRESRDIILLDQRGTGYGEPNLKCPELFRNLDFREATAECRLRLSEQGYDLSTFNSAQNAQDVSALIKAFEFDSVNLLGVSYGTRLALTLMRDAPEGIRSVILDSTYPPQANRLNEFGANFERVLSQVFNSCAQSQACSNRYPNLEGSFYETLNWLELNPIVQPFSELELGAQEVLNVLFQAMYDEQLIPSLPYAFEKLAEDDFNSFVLIAAGLATAEELDTGEFNVLDVFRALGDIFKFIWREVQSEGVYFSTECPEDTFFQHFRTVRRETQSLPPVLEELANESALQMFAACRAWQAPRGEMIESQPVNSDLPTLVLAGSFDPITPPEWGLRAAKTLSNSYFYEFPNAAHGVFASGDCAIGLIEAFLNNPSQAPDASCIDEIEFEFYVPN